MISNDHHCELAKAELAKWRDNLVELETTPATPPRTISAQVSTFRPAAIRQRIRELEMEIRQYETARRSVAMASSQV